MSTQFISRIKKTTIASTLLLALSTPAYATIYNITGSFTMYGESGNIMEPTDTTILGTYDDTDPSSMRVTTSDLFFGSIWLAYNLQVTTTPGTYTVETCPTPADGSVVPVEGGGGAVTPCTPPLELTMIIADDQWGVQMLFDWNTSSLIDVVNVWDVTYNNDGSIRLTSTDFDGDGIFGTGMADGPFQRSNANFDLLLSPPFLVNITASQDNGALVVLDPNSVDNVTLDATVADATAYDWSGSDLAIRNAVIGNTNNATLVIDQTDAGLTPGQTYNIRVNVTKPTDSGPATSTGLSTIRVASFALTAVDTDGDGINDEDEGFSDTDGDRIPEFLDTSSATTELTVNPGDNSLGNILTSEGTIAALGNKSFQNAIDNFDSVTDNNFGAAISVSTIGENDSTLFKTFCTGGCIDVSVTDVTNSSVQIVVPLSAAIPVHPVLRVYKSSIGWTGFEIDSNNHLASAAATSTNPTICPAPGLSSYSAGLIEGNHCLQITVGDNGPNDNSSLASGTISILASSAELIISAPSAGSGSASWFLLFFFPATTGFRYFRNK